MFGKLIFSMKSEHMGSGCRNGGRSPSIQGRIEEKIVSTNEVLRTLLERGFGYVSLNERLSYGGGNDPGIPKSYFLSTPIIPFRASSTSVACAETWWALPGTVGTGVLKTEKLGCPTRKLEIVKYTRGSLGEGGDPRKGPGDGLTGLHTP